MSNNNKDVARRFIDEVWNNGNVAVLDETHASDYIHHDPANPDLGPGPQGEKKRVALYRGAFPDLHFKVEELVGEGDIVVARWSTQGTHKNELAGIPPTNKRITVTGVSVMRFADGRIAEDWVAWDALGMLRQLGVVAEMAAAR